MAHFPSGEFSANSAWTQLAAITHNLSRWSQIIGLPGASPRMLETFQRRLLRIPGLLVRLARRIVLHLPARWPWQCAFVEALERIRTLPAHGCALPAYLTRLSLAGGRRQPGRGRPACPSEVLPLAVRGLLRAGARRNRRLSVGLAECRRERWIEA